ncbi:MAG: tRNA (N(6)-L-threonylcarbamoyladenosine(37)-C(2))-methylthiotransferase MtaB [Bacteroides sp.]|nr:tRNA (N(6)-L-threonylcarbamoyladenosine(37)-C(2))-methylthiotransferase MtaB [Ruminococcus flavefaciens]MCM1554581.1 tRNA (N(6)-L-threonylcarbamoyladenosine(37)-C(2))-methylthiotransferase MtaB [Bacteroides sp.]
MPKVAFYTLGCRLNFAETSDLARRFAEQGYTVVPFEQAADLYVINTCTVTAAAEKKCRQTIRSAHRLNPGAKIAVVGCFSELRPQEVERLPGVDFVLGNRNKHLLFDYMRGEKGPESASEQMPFVPSYSTLGRTRSFFKIQDGCNNFCSYCAIPYARGRSRSDTVERTMQTAREIAATGVKEIVLTGVNIGDFGRYHGETFYGLLEQLEQLPGVERIRIGSVEPDLLGDDIVELMARSSKLMPHFHIPLQAGSDEVLKQMKRHYDRAFYAGRVEKIRTLIPHAFIACDVIAGFPTETSAQFEDACRFLEDLDLSALHVFSYSHRAEAAASHLDFVYPAGELARRSTVLHELSDRKKQAFYARFLGTEASVLWESDNHDGRMYGYTPNYLRVCRPFDGTRVNTVGVQRLDELKKDTDKDWCFIG